MTFENLKKHHARLKWLASGEFTERDFDYEILASENTVKGEKEVAGWCTMGEMSSQRKALIQQDAERTLKNFLRKYPEFVKEEKPKTAAKPKEEKPKEKA